eukprot:2986177-Rhodomonas_salina.1
MPVMSGSGVLCVPYATSGMRQGCVHANHLRAVCDAAMRVCLMHPDMRCDAAAQRARDPETRLRARQRQRLQAKLAAAQLRQRLRQ